MTNRKPDINGWWEIKGNPLTKVGVFPYSGASIGAPDPNKIYNVYRPEEELSDPECINSFKLIPMMDDHPKTLVGSEKDGFIPTENKGIDGVIGEEVYFEDGILKGNIKIFSDKIKKTIQDGKEELSAGYKCIYNFVSGVYNGINYDAIQTKIRGNHLALVTEGRAGPDIAVMDSFIFTIDSKELIMNEENKTKAVKDEGITLEALAAQVKTLADAVAKMTQAEKAEANGTLAKDEEKPAETVPAMTDAACDADKATGMDAKEVEKLIRSSIEKAKKEITLENSEKSKFVEKLSSHIGTFDAKEKSLIEVLKYGISKLGINCEAGQEKAALEGYFHAQKNSDKKAFALDASEKEVVNNFITRHGE